MIPASARIHDAEIEGRVVLGENCVIGNRVVVRAIRMDAGGSITTRHCGRACRDWTGAKPRDYCPTAGIPAWDQRRYGHGAVFGRGARQGVLLSLLRGVGRGRLAVDFGAATVCGNLRFDDGETVWRVKGRRRCRALLERGLFRLLPHRRQRHSDAGAQGRRL